MQLINIYSDVKRSVESKTVDLIIIYTEEIYLTDSQTAHIFYCIYLLIYINNAILRYFTIILLLHIIFFQDEPEM
jgi:hypothetical protein